MRLAIPCALLGLLVVALTGVIGFIVPVLGLLGVSALELAISQRDSRRHPR